MSLSVSIFALLDRAAAHRQGIQKRKPDSYPLAFHRSSHQALIHAIRRERQDRDGFYHAPKLPDHEASA